APGMFTKSLTIPASPGVWRVTEGGLTAYAARTEANTAEYQNLAASAALVTPVARNIIWLGSTPTPSLSSLLRPRHATQITGARSIPLLPPLPGLMIALALIIGAWWRETGARP
ncbi:MAG: hypothetical protein POH28_12205, partial [Acidocella sp.]|nr:hypothetical protein [Acidocella sp.]